MSKIPTEKQIFPVNPLQQIEHQTTQRKAVSGPELLHAIECSVGHPLDDRLREVISKLSVAAVKRRGRPPKCHGREDFALEDLDQRYSELLQRFQNDPDRKSAPGDPSPSERAYRQLATEMRDDFGNIDGPALANKHSIWKKRSIPTADQLDFGGF